MYTYIYIYIYTKAGRRYSRSLENHLQEVVLNRVCLPASTLRPKNRKLTNISLSLYIYICIYIYIYIDTHTTTTTNNNDNNNDNDIDNNDANDRQLRIPFGDHP